MFLYFYFEFVCIFILYSTSEFQEYALYKIDIIIIIIHWRCPLFNPSI